MEEPIYSMEYRPIGYIETDFKEKFGIPRQSGRVPELIGIIHFYKEYQRPEAFRGLSDFSHIWILFDFSMAHREQWSPTVRPPRLGGNTRVGVFATRSPFRPNSIGLSSVKLLEVRKNTDEITLVVSGVDLLDHTPILDIKPYIPYADCHSDAKGSYSDLHQNDALLVDFPEELLNILPMEKREACLACLKEDPRPSYQDDMRDYHMQYDHFDIGFHVNGSTLSVFEVKEK